MTTSWTGGTRASTPSLMRFVFGDESVTEAHVAAAMHEVSQGRTTIVIAHRLQTARAADRIIVLHGGEVAEVGSHEELLELGGRYAAMWDAFEFAGRGAAG